MKASILPDLARDAREGLGLKCVLGYISSQVLRLCIFEPANITKYPFCALSTNDVDAVILVNVLPRGVVD